MHIDVHSYFTSHTSVYHLLYYSILLNSPHVMFSFYLFSWSAMDVQAFERLLGPCMDIMKRNIANYEEQLVTLFGSSTEIEQQSA